jgi:hypothetical protein
MMKRRRSFVLAALLAALAAPAGADAGARIGASIDPDQVYFGLDAELMRPHRAVGFRLGADLGLGDPGTLLAINADFVHRFRGGAWRPLVGAGPALLLFLDDDADVEAGLNFLFALEHRDGFFVEARVGALDSPDIKVGAGIRF